MFLILGIIIGLITGGILGIALSFPIGSAFGIILDRTFNTWAIGIEIVLIILSAYIIFRMFSGKRAKKPRINKSF